MSEHSASDDGVRPRLAALALGAVGVVYGDLGTSPLYTMHECFSGSGHTLDLTPANVMGVLSLIFWALVIVITLKYVLFIMRADNHGEGGILALLALTPRGREESERRRWFIVALGLSGAALFYGDGMVTPAISVLSAVEGLDIATPLLKPYIIPLTIFVLILLFMVQRKGTDSVGAFFGPVMLVWFATLSVLGVRQIIEQPDVLAAIDPSYALDFLLEHGWGGFVSLGAVVLAVTGAEALYADMGHFGRKPIQVAWFALVLPALLLNYFGQGALLINHPEAVENPFYLLAPSWALYPMVALSTLAAVIASQAVISGAFSLSRQAVQLGYCPRLEVIHTSRTEVGQIYIREVNWGLLVAIIILVLGFKSSSNLAAAYGIAVTGTMVVTTILAALVARRLWGWSWTATLLVAGSLLAIDLAFFSANMLKILDGGWFPLAIGAVAFTLMTTWKRGREILFDRLRAETMPLDAFLERIGREKPGRVAGTAVFMTGGAGGRDGVPYALLHNLKHNKVLHERVILLTVTSEPVPILPEERRFEVIRLEKGFYRIYIRYGFMEDPNVPKVLERCHDFGLAFDLMDTSFFLGRERLVPSIHPEMALWREKIFIGMSRNALSATDFFKIPSGRVVELGTQVEL